MKNPKSHFEAGSRIPSKIRRNSSDSRRYGMAVILMYNVSGTALYLTAGGANCIAQNLTVHNANTFAFSNQGTNSLALTNSLLVACTNLGSSFSGAYNYTNQIDAGIFQTAAGGTAYLATNCPPRIRGAGTTNIDPALLAELQTTTTTEPPDTSFVGQTISTSTNFSPLGLANTNTPDLGYHYPILDYVFSQCLANGAGANTLTFEPGTAVGWFGQGLVLTNSAYVNFDGLVASPCYFVRCNTVQEQDLTGDTNTIGITSVDINNQTTVQATFTRFSAAGGLATFFDASYLGITMYNCEFWDGLLGGNVTGGTIALELSLVNCLLDRSSTAFYTGNSSPYWTLTMQNCTLHGGSLYLSQSNTTYIYPSDAQIYDSAFDGTKITVPTAGITTDNNNAYLTNATTLPNQSQDPQPQTNFNWQTGPLGSYYLPAVSPLRGAGYPAASGISDPTYSAETYLNIFTTQTNQTPDNGPAVDIGYHHAAPSQGQSFNNYQSPICPHGQWSFNLFNNNYGSTDLWGLPVTISIPIQPQHGSLTNTDNGGNYTYSATNCYAGADSFTYQMNDGLFTSPPAMVYVMVADKFFNNSYPYSPLPVTVPINGSTNITLQPSGCDTPLTVAVTRNPAHGSLTPLNNDQTIYTPSNNYSGPDSFEFQVSDACGEAASFIVPITVGTNAAGPFTLVTQLNSADHPNGIDYSPTQNALIVSEYGDSVYGGDNFLQLGTNANGTLTVTNFSGVADINNGDEVKLATVGQNTNGFIQGDVFFGNNDYPDIGWISANGSQSNLNWCILTNSTVTNTMKLRGGLYVDQTGVFSDELIALASDGTGPSPSVWLVNSNGSPTLLTEIQPQIEAASGDNLEGVISLPNNTNRWGPWAGKILTGDEDSGILYAIDTNGTITPYDLGIASDYFNIIPTNEDLYVSDYGGSRILKLSRSLFSNYVGDLLITQEGGVGSFPAELFVVNWDGTNFISREINVSAYASESEDATFAPLDLPSQAIQ